MNYCFGIDIGGTTVKMGLFTAEGELLEKWEIKTHIENQGEAILPDVAKAVIAKLDEREIAKEDIIGLGVGVPAAVSGDGVVKNTTNLGWGYKEVKKELMELTEIPVIVENDANVAALGEMWKGGGKGYKNVVMVTLGTGVGGGIIVDGKIVSGANGGAGEIGHICVNYDETERCGCGKKGCIEQYASATGIARLARKRLVDNKDLTILMAEGITAKEVWDAVKEGDKVAKEIAEVFGTYLGRALADVAATVDPEVFVIGGGVSKAGDILLSYIEPVYRDFVFYASKDTIFALATLGNDAGICGAAKMILD